MYLFLYINNSDWWKVDVHTLLFILSAGNVLYLTLKFRDRMEKKLTEIRQSPNLNCVKKNPKSESDGIKD